MTELEQKVRAARDMISDLCRRRDEAGKREWIMSIPARPDHDPDLVIAAALDAQAAEIKALRDALAGALKIPRPWLDGGVSEAEWIAAFDKIEAALAAEH